MGNKNGPRSEGQNLLGEIGGTGYVQPGGQKGKEET